MTNEKCQIIATAIAKGVQFMHTRCPAIVHQDLKPLNIMVCELHDYTHKYKQYDAGDI